MHRRITGRSTPEFCLRFCRTYKTIYESLGEGVRFFDLHFSYIAFGRHIVSYTARLRLFVKYAYQS